MGKALDEGGGRMSYFAVYPRQNGRTMGLIMLSAACNERIIVPTPDKAKYIAKQARDMGLRIPYPVVFCELSRQARPNGEVLVDESLSIKPVDVMAVQGSLRKANPAIPGDVTSRRKRVGE